ncbi:MAG: helix-hairpin-helix domain-containing protein, partial [Myxococcota bacterium]
MTRTAGVVADDELDQLLSGASAVPGQPLGPSPGARDLARAVGVAWVELIADLAGQAILGRTVRHPDKLAGVVTDVARLARELDDRELVALDEQLPQLVAATFDAPDAEGRKQAGLALRDWVATYADIIGGDGGRRLRRKVVLRRGVHPLATHLRGIKGIGERRLERLYDARLLTRDALADAQPEELAAVARIPLAR